MAESSITQAAAKISKGMVKIETFKARVGAPEPAIHIPNDVRVHTVVAVVLDGIA